MGEASAGQVFDSADAFESALRAALAAADALTAERDALRACLTELRDAAAARLTEVTP
jgi:hypothetical protein